MTRQYPHPATTASSSRARAPAVSRATTLRRSLSSRQRRDRDALEDDVSSIVMRVPDPHSSDDETNDARDREDDAMHCRACGHDHAPGTTCGVCGHHREKCDRKAAGWRSARRRRGDPIIEVIDKFCVWGVRAHVSRGGVIGVWDTNGDECACVFRAWGRAFARRGVL